MEELIIHRTHTHKSRRTNWYNLNISNKNTQAHTHTHLKTSAIMIIHIDNIAKRTEKHVGEMTLFRITTHTHIDKSDRSHMYKSRISNMSRTSHTHTQKSHWKHMKPQLRYHRSQRTHSTENKKTEIKSMRFFLQVSLEPCFYDVLGIS